MRSYFTHILANKPRGTLYVGVTNGLISRIEAHRAGTGSVFTRRYGVHPLVWFEEFHYVDDAIRREAAIKGWPRAWKVNLIERSDRHWSDLYPQLPGVRPVPDDWHVKAAKNLGLDEADRSRFVMAGFSPAIQHQACYGVGNCRVSSASRTLRSLMTDGWRAHGPP